MCEACPEMINHNLTVREIRFTRDDFEWYFENEGLDFDSLTDDEWRRFENMFMEGTGWDEVARIAASEIKIDRTLKLT